MGIIDKMAKACGEEPLDMLNRLLREHGSIYRVAQFLHTTPNTIHDWRKRRGYTTKVQRITRLVKTEQSEGAE